jgi:large subunit ribosomal protein L32e
MADEIRRLIRVRTRKGATFKRDGFGKKKQLSSSWRKPRGQHNKQREQKKAKGALPKPGFGSPIAVRGMHPSGFFEVLVYTANDLEGLNPKTQAIRIASTVGGRKRAAIQDKALAAGLRILNAKATQPMEKPVAPAAVVEKDQEPKKKKKPAQKAKPAAGKKKETPKAKKEVKKAPKEPAPKKAKETKKAESAEEPQKKKEQKPKVPKAKAEAGTEVKPKKAAKSKAEPAKETKAPKKTAPKPAAKPKKKTSSGVKGNE